MRVANESTNIKELFTFWDSRFDAYRESPLPAVPALRDLLAASVVVLIAIPVSMGYAIASGVRPEQGIIAGALAAMIGGVFGGSRYQILGPTAGLIPVIGEIVHRFDVPFLSLAGMIAGSLIMLGAISGMARMFHLVPYSIIVGFTLGIALIIGTSQIPNVIGTTQAPTHQPIERLGSIPAMIPEAHLQALALATFTFTVVAFLNRFSVFIPGALIAMVICTSITATIWDDRMIPLIATQFGDIGGRLFAFTPPSLGRFALIDLVVPVITLVMVASLESLLCASMADQLAESKKPCNLNKELVSLGIANILVPLFNGMPSAGAVSRTAANIQVGAVSPFAAIIKGMAVLVLLFCFATYLNAVPMSFIGGLLIFVATRMVTKAELARVNKEGRFHVFLMIYTAAMTLITNLLLAVVSATIIFHAVTRMGKRHLAGG